jgi:hypothetical protein
MSMKTSLTCLALSLACGGQGASDAFDVEVADEMEGLRASTTVDGERILIEARIVAGQARADDDDVPEDVLTARVSGDGEIYADWRIGIVSDHVSGTMGGWTFGEADAARDWAAMAGSPVARVLGEVSRRAGAALASGDHPQVELELFTVADMGPYLAALPVIMDGLEAVCGDGECSVDETDANCPEDCGCAHESACGGVAPFGCYCGDDCAENGDCCVDACQTCGAGCPPCGDAIPCDGACINASNVCNGQVECLTGEDEARCASGSCRAGQFACDSGACLEFYQWCDGEADCPGGEDEVCECAYCDPG